MKGYIMLKILLAAFLSLTFLVPANAQTLTTEAIYCHLNISDTQGVFGSLNILVFDDGTAEINSEIHITGAQLVFVSIFEPNAVALAVTDNEVIFVAQDTSRQETMTVHIDFVNQRSLVDMPFEYNRIRDENADCDYYDEEVF